MVGRGEVDEAAELVPGCGRDRARHHLRLVRRNRHRPALEARKAGNHHARIVGLQLEEAPPVEDRSNRLFHVVRTPPVLRDEVTQDFPRPVGRRFRLRRRRPGPGIRRHEGEVALQLPDGVRLVLGGVVRHARDAAMHLPAAELLLGYALAGAHRHQRRPAGGQHALPLHHDDELHHGREQGAVPGRRAQHRRDRRRRAREPRHIHEMVHRRQPLADIFVRARPRPVEQPDQRHPVAERQFDHPVLLREVHQAERAAQHGEVLGDHAGNAPVDPPEAGHDAVGGRHLVLHRRHARRRMRRKPADLREAARIHEHGDALARRLLAGPALAGDLRLAAMPFGRGPAAREFVQQVAHPRNPSTGHAATAGRETASGLR